MKNKISVLFLTVFCGTWLSGQTLTGNLHLLANQAIELKGFKGLQDYTIGTAAIDASGNFTLHYTQADQGMGYLMSPNGKPYIVMLSGENIALKGEDLNHPETIKTTKGQQNQWFEKYAQDYALREQALSAWDYLEKLYVSDSLFLSQKKIVGQLQSEKQRIKAEDAAFLAKLPKDSYVRWFLPVRKLISSVSVVAQGKPQEIPATLAALRQIDYADPRLYKSGLFKEAIENHVWFIENSSGPLDRVAADLNKSIDGIINQLKSHPERFNEVTNYLFNLLENRSLFASAEYLALKVLGDEGCTVDDKVSSKLESYRAMRIGNKAPDILFGTPTNYNQAKHSPSLKQLDAALKLVVFAAGWCSHCQEILPKLAAGYPQWRAKGMEIILVTLDGNQQDYETFTKGLPFVTTSELNVWEGKAVNEYHVYATPTLFLVDKDLKILLKPSSVEQVDSYLEYEYKK